MPTSEQQSNPPSEQAHDGAPDSAESHEGTNQHYRTVAVRVEEGVHAQLRFIAQLSGSRISDEIRTAIKRRIATAQDDPELTNRAQQIREEIEREAAARSAAIAGFMGKPAVQAAASRGSGRAARSRVGSSTPKAPRGGSNQAPRGED